jgi:hypothetical protein
MKSYELVRTAVYEPPGYVEEGIGPPFDAWYAEAPGCRDLGASSCSGRKLTGM